MAYLKYFYAVIISAAILLCYQGVLLHDFLIFDDRIYVTENPIIGNGLTLYGVQAAFGFMEANWIPLTWISHMIDVEIFGMSPGGHHLTSLIFHILNGILLFFIFSKLTKKSGIAFFMALLFSLHPLRVESVAWIAERKDVLSLFFALIAIYAYLSYPKEKPRTLVGMMPIYLLSAFAMMSKPMMVTLPFVLLLLDYWPGDRLKSFKFMAEAIIEKLPIFLFTGVTIFLTLLAQDYGKAIVSLSEVSLSMRFDSALQAPFFYIEKLFYPVNLSVYYLPNFKLFSLDSFICGVVLLFSTLVLFFSRKKYPFMLIGWLWFLGTLVPVLGLVKAGIFPVADRFSYFPHIGLFLVFVMLLDRWERKSFIKLLSIILGIVISIVLYFQTTTYLKVWKNSETLFQSIIRNEPEHYLAYKILADYSFQQKDVQSTKYYLNKVIETAPSQNFGSKETAHTNLGVIYLYLKDYQRAIYHYKEVLKENPDHFYALWGLGNCFYDLKNKNQALKYYEKAATIKISSEIMAKIKRIMDEKKSHNY